MTTPTTEPLWDNERIISEAEALVAFWKQHETPRSLYRRDIKTCLTQMRDDYQQRIAEHAALVQEAANDAADLKHYAAVIEKQDAELEALRAQVAWKESVIRQLIEVDMPSLEAQVAQLQGEAGAWEDVKYEDVINVDNGCQIRIVGVNATSLHIRKRINGTWVHDGLTKIADNIRIQRKRGEVAG